MKHLVTAIFVCFLFVCSAKQQATTNQPKDTTSSTYSLEKDLQEFLLQQKNRSNNGSNDAASDLKDRKEYQDLLKEIALLKGRDSALYALQKKKVESLRASNKGIPVAPFKDTIFLVYNQIGGYSPKDRATVIENRIRALAGNFTFSPDSLKLVQNENGWVIFWKDQTIAGVNDQDALWANSTSKQLAEFYFVKIKNALQQHREENSWKKIATEVLTTLAIISLVLAIIFFINKLTHKIKEKVSSKKTSFFKEIKIGSYELISSARQLKVVWSIITILKWILILISIYLALPLILNLFPDTKDYASILINYIISPIKKLTLSVINYLPNLITIVIISIVFHYLLKALKFFANELKEGKLNIPGFYKDWSIPTYQILRMLLLAFYFVIVFPYFPGSDTAIFKGVSVFFGVLLTFSSAGPVGNIVAGLLITYMRSFSIGDRIKIGEVSGDIIEKSLLVTRIRTIKNEVISIPNSQILNSHTINYSAALEDNPLIIYTQITIGYDVPWQTIHELSINACNQTIYLEKEPAPFVMQTSLDDFYVTYQINAYTKNSHKQAIIYSELHKHILDLFHEAGVEIMSPHYAAVRDGSQKGIPTEQVDEESFTNKFRVEFSKKKE